MNFKMIEPNLNQTSKSTYMSCIKISGVPILPPLITTEKRIELEEYKKKAVDIERRLRCERDLKLFIKRLPDPILNEIPVNNSRTVIKTLENLLTFGDGDDSHVDALVVSDKSSDSKLPSDECKTCVPLNEQNHKPSKLTCNIVDVTQYSDEGVVIFNDYNKTGEINQISELSASIVELDLTSLGSMDNLSMCNNNDLKRSPKLHSPKRRLLRSNSYTLESPSPVLLEHFKKQAQLEPDGAATFQKYLGQQRSLSSDSFTFANVQNQEPLIIKSTVPNRNSHQYSNNIENDKCDKQGCDVPVESMNEIVEGLAQLHFGVNPQEKDLVEAPSWEVQKRGEAIHDKIVEAEAALHEVLSDMPESCAKDIMDLLERHKLDQALQLESYTNFKQKLLDEHANSNSMSQSESNGKPDTSDQSDQKEQDLISLYDEESKSCTIHCLTSTSTDSSHLLNASTSLIDFETDPDQFEPVCTRNVLSRATNHQRSRESWSSNCSRELFAEKPDKVQRRLQEQWAAMILTSAAKGYLVRRLKRTERVRNLIQTIRDAVVCAMGLHSEETECIQSSDVELHRRLIQQISAACFEFYHIFFGLSTKEQMDIIALDRQKLQEKLKRPPSSSSIKLDAKKSTPKVPRQSFSARQKKLSPSFAA